MKVSDIVGRKKVDINVDIAEGFPYDEQLLVFATSANICCGVHAGSEEITLASIAMCQEKGIRIGAHPGYPDRASMGREGVSEELARTYLASIFDQVKWFSAVAKMDYIKPHGGFYHDTAQILPPDWEVSQRKQPLASKYENGGLYLALYPGLQSLSMLLRVHKVALMGMEVTAHKILAERAGQHLIREGFADRAYQADGQLVSRRTPGAVVSNPLDIRRQVVKIAPFVDSICIHGDTENCVEIAEHVYAALADEGYDIAVAL